MIRIFVDVDQKVVWPIELGYGIVLLNVLLSAGSYTVR
jgi:hypothetical protein